MDGPRNPGARRRSDLVRADRAIWPASIRTASKSRGTIDGRSAETRRQCEPVRAGRSRPSPPSKARALGRLPTPIANCRSRRQSAARAISIRQLSGRRFGSEADGRHLEPAIVRPGESARLEITATLPPGWHVYAHRRPRQRQGSKPTLIAIRNSVRSGAASHRRPMRRSKPTTRCRQFGPMRYHDGTVTWTTQIDVPATARRPAIIRSAA